MSNNDTIITVDNLSKAYLLGQQERNDTFFATMANMVKAPLRNLRRLHRLNTFNLKEAEAVDTDDILWALKDVSFEVKRGECLGIIGRNGAGKSTLLKILSRIAEPTRGRIEMKGRVSALLEVGTGFHPELTGRENVYLNGTILGMKKAEIDKKFDEIVDFSGVEKFLDTPVKRYSSGMRVRLAFAVAAHLEPEILIVDEVLAVGDAEFQKKCLGKMQDVATGEGRTVLFVSHNMGAVQNLCSRGIVLGNGAMVFNGGSEEAVSEYMGAMTSQVPPKDLTDPSVERTGDGRVRFTAARCLNKDGEETDQLVAGEPVTFELEYFAKQHFSKIEASIILYNQQSVPVTLLTTKYSGDNLSLDEMNGTIKCKVDLLPFPTGNYFATIIFRDGNDCDYINDAFRFTVYASIFFPNGKTPNLKYCTAMVKHFWIR